MKVAGEYVFDGPREEVWELLRDPDVLVTALPGTQSLEQTGENEYVGNMHVRIGPVSGVFSGHIVISNEVEPESYTMTVEGKGSATFVKASGDVQLIAQSDDATLMKYEGEFQVGGKLVSVGQRLIDSVSKRMLRQGLDTLNEVLKERVATRSAD
jgi:carbon monoxide dehydrogenase subunit G